MSQEIFLVIAAGIPWTLLVAGAAFFLGALLGIPLCAMHVSGNSVLHFIAVSIILALRSIPPIVLLFILYFGVGSGYIQVSAIQAAIVGLGLLTAANMAEIYRGALRSIHPGQWEAARALNLPAWSQFRDVIAPQLGRVSLPTAATYLIGLLKDSAIASTIGVPEIAFQASYMSRHTFQGLEVFAVAGLMYILISLPIAVFSRFIDKTVRAKVA